MHAGYSAAITARKRDKSVVVIGQNSGWLAHAHSIANYPGLPDISGHDLLEAMKKQAQDLGAELRPGVVHQIVSLGSSFALSLGADFIEAKRIILCTGAKQPKLLPGESELLGRGVSYCGTCDGMFYRGKRVACRRLLIIGGAEQRDQPHQEQQHHQRNHRLVAGSSDWIRHGSFPPDCMFFVSFAAGHGLTSSP